MKKHITRNNLKNETVIVVKDIQHLLFYKKPYGYNAGVFGWNYDVYNVNDLVVCTGDRTIRGDYQVNYIDCKKYDDLAREIVNSWDLNYEEKKPLVNELLNNFIEEVISNDN